MAERQERMDVLNVENIVKSYGKRRVVDGVSFHVSEGEVVGLLGPNGAGKSTSFRITCGQLPPDSGKVILCGQDVTDWPMYRRARDGGMAYLAQEASIFRKMRVDDNILSLLELLGVPRRQRMERCEQLMEQMQISEHRNKLASQLSGGLRRKLEIARCLVANPKIIMLDEPFAGIDPISVDSIQEVILQLREDGISSLITDHAALELLGFVDRAYVIYRGQVLFEGLPDEVRNNRDVIENYLGQRSDAAPSTPTGIDSLTVPGSSATRSPHLPAPHWPRTTSPQEKQSDPVRSNLRRRGDV
jgi:lipopolysaccharide export system ATP-binding protein